MDYCKIEHKEKRVSFTDGRKGVEYYVHIKSRALIRDYKDRFDALKSPLFNEDMIMVYGLCSWQEPVGWGSFENYSLEMLCKDLCDEIKEKFGCDEGYWSGSLKPDGIYLNFRAYKFD